jgi:predicted ATPase
MGEQQDENTREHPHQEGSAVSPTTQQMRTVGQRRRDAEEKLEHHLEEVRHKDEARNDHAPEQEDVGAVDGSDVAAIQSDDRLTAADRVDLIANQVVTRAEDGEDSSEPDNKP